MHDHPTFAATLHAGTRQNELRVAFHIGNASLIDLVRAAELPFATQDGAASLAGNYAWPALTPRLLRLLEGDPASERTVQGTLLNCDCGLHDCWPLAINVRVQRRIVVWEAFCQLRRPERWNYRALAPIRFSTAPYLQEVSQLRAAYAARERARNPAASPASSACAL